MNEQRNEHPDSADRISLDFLESSTKPESLGRLGAYEILEVVGRGSFGILLKAFDDALQRVVAIKVLIPELAANSPARQRFLREARASAAVRHENIVHIYAVEEEPLPHLVMEYVPGETIQQRIDAQGPLETVDVVRIGLQIARGLEAAHAIGLIHRDIKPANILLEGSSDASVKLTDFGLARAADDASFTRSGVIAGTPMYLSPEQATGGTIDHRTDLFSLGSVLYVMICGRPPFRAPTTLAVLNRIAEASPRPIPEILATVPDWLCNLITKLHAKHPDDRYRSAKDVADLLGRCLFDIQRGKLPAIPHFRSTALQQPPTGRTRIVYWGLPLLLVLATFCYFGVNRLYNSGSNVESVDVSDTLDYADPTSETAEKRTVTLGPLLTRDSIADGEFSDISYDAGNDVLLLNVDGNSKNLWINFQEVSGLELSIVGQFRVLNSGIQGFAKLVFKPHDRPETFVLIGNKSGTDRIWIDFGNKRRREEDGIPLPQIRNSKWMNVRFIVSKDNYEVRLDGKQILLAKRDDRHEGYVAVGGAEWRCEFKNLRVEIPIKESP